MRDYKVFFYKKSEKQDQPDELLGSVEVSDQGTGPHLTLVAKAFRHAEDKCSRADRVTVQPIRRGA